MTGLLKALGAFLRAYGFPVAAALLLGALLWKQTELSTAQAETMRQHDEMQATWFVLLEKYQAVAGVTVTSPCDKGDR